MESNLQQVQVHIGGRSYPLRVDKDELSLLQVVEKEVNGKIHEFQQAYLSMDKQDHLAMTLLVYAVDLYKTRNHILPESSMSLSAEMEKIEQMISDMLGEP